MSKLLITYTKSSIGYSRTQKATVRSLGLGKLNSSVIHDDSPAIRGMVFAVRHLVTVQEVADDAQLPVRNATVRPKVIDTVLQTTANPAAVAEPSVPATPAVDTAEPEVADVFSKIAGVADLLAGAGYATYADLGQADVATLRALLADAKLPMAKPDTWPEQAQLAAAGDWEALELLQQRLVAGRSESE